VDDLESGRPVLRLGGMEHPVGSIPDKRGQDFIIQMARHTT